MRINTSEKAAKKGHGLGDPSNWRARSIGNKADRIMIVTDGVPTGGRYWNLELLVQRLEWLRRWRGTVLDVVLVDVPGPTRRHWEWLASRTGGECSSVSFSPEETGRGTR